MKPMAYRMLSPESSFAKLKSNRAMKIIPRGVWCAIIALAIHPVTASADILVDPTLTSGGSVQGWGSGSFSGDVFGQTFVADASSVDLIGLYLTMNFDGSIPPAELHLSLFDGDGFSGALLYTSTSYMLNPNNAFVYFDMFGTNLILGHVYTVGLTEPGFIPPNWAGRPDFAQWSISGGGGGGLPDIYADGHAIYHGQADPERDLFFRVLDTYDVPPPPMPSPVPDTCGSIWLLSFAFICLAGIGRWSFRFSLVTAKVS
jgi:hypothetical protein